MEVSFEVYPPRNPADSPKLEVAITKLAELEPNFISVTFGAGGSSTKNSLDVLEFIGANTGAKPLAHLTCVGTTEQQARELVEEFVSRGIADFLALRGDLPQGQQAPAPSSLSRADQLVTLIRETPGHGSIAVAAFPNGHPESRFARTDIDALLAKQDAGADFAITQLFFFTADYLNFLELARSRGVTIPIIPGIMPIVSLKRLARVLELSGEAEPSALAALLASAEDFQAQVEVGIEWAANQVRELKESGVEAVHLYAFNEFERVTQVLQRSGVRS